MLRQSPVRGSFSWQSGGTIQAMNIASVKIVYRISEQDFMEARELFIANERPWYRKFSRFLMPWISGAVLLMHMVYLIVVPNRDIFTVISLMVGFTYCTAGWHYVDTFAASIKKTIATNMTSPPKSPMKVST